MLPPNEGDPSESSHSDGSDQEAGGSATSTSFHPNEQHDTKIDQAFIQREEKQVRKVRWLLAFATLACAIAVSVAVYISAKQNEQSNFEQEVRVLGCDFGTFERLANNSLRTFYCYHSTRFLLRTCSCVLAMR
jgi:hypothetical protein